MSSSSSRGTALWWSIECFPCCSMPNGASSHPSYPPLLQVSWLGAWTLLLGCWDYHDEQQMQQGMPCLRPGEEEMLELAALWARIAAAAEVTSCEGEVQRLCGAVVDANSKLLCLLASRAA